MSPSKSTSSHYFRQIVHYPENIDLQTAKGQSRVVLREQGVDIKVDA